jgi:hypothetical protein
MKWSEEVALKRVDSEELIKFLKYNILLRFGVPRIFLLLTMVQFSSGQNLQNFVENMASSWGSHQIIIHKGMVLQNPPIRHSFKY